LDSCKVQHFVYSRFVSILVVSRGRWAHSKKAFWSRNVSSQKEQGYIFSLVIFRETRVILNPRRVGNYTPAKLLEERRSRNGRKKHYSQSLLNSL
jgi:hypothetical protein